MIAVRLAPATMFSGDASAASVLAGERDRTVIQPIRVYHPVRYNDATMKVIRIGIAPQARIRERMLAIARGELKSKASDPKIWFTSMRSLSQVLSDENRACSR